MLQVLHVPTLVDNYVWLIRRSGRPEVIIVDPGEECPVLEKLAELKLTPVAILVTHYHYDHTYGLDPILEEFPVPVYGPRHIRQVDHPVTEGDTVTIPELEVAFQVLDVRGHTHDHIAFLTDNMLFSGDVIFSAGCGRLFDGTLEQMAQAVARLAALPDDTVVYGAHEYTATNLKFAAAVEPDNPDISEYSQWVMKQRQQQLPTLPTTIGKEKRINPFLRVGQEAVIAAVQNHNRDMNSTEPADVFIALRRWKDGFQG